MPVKITLNWSKLFGYENWADSNIPESAGVYVYLVRQNDSSIKMRYVGICDNLRTRCQDHMGNSEENECIKTNLAKYAWDFRYALVPIQADREDAEQALYDKYKPECNKVRPNGSGRKVPIEIEGL